MFHQRISRFVALLSIVSLLLGSMGTPQTAFAAPAGTALQFNGTSQYVTFGQASGLGLTSFTLESWIKRTGSGTTVSTGTGGVVAVPLITKGRCQSDASNLDANYFLGINTSNQLVADFEDMNNGLNHPVTGVAAIPTDGTWHHVAVTYDQPTGIWNLYLDGNLDKTAAVTGVAAVRSPRSDSIQHAALGAALDSTGSPNAGCASPGGFFQGVMDEARIWNRVLTQSEIQTNRFSELTGGTGLIARWGLNEGIGTTINSSVGTFPGTLINGPIWVSGFPIPDTTPPAAPSGLTAAAGSTLVDLSWQANSEADITGYNLYRSTVSGGPYTKINGSPMTGTTYLDSSLTNDTTYYYVITAVDTSSNESGYSAEVSATPQPGAFGLDFGSGTAYVTFGDPAKLDLAQFTIETWFKRTGAGAPNTTGSGGIASAIPLVTHGAPEADGSNVDANWILVIDDATDVLAADFEDTATGLNHPVRGTTVISNNIWHHAAATYDGATWRLYLDGRLETTLAVNAAPRSDSIQRAGLGTMLTSTGTALGHFQGVLDEARVWDVARTQADIVADINNQLTSGNGLVARWGFGEGAGTTVSDSIAVAANGTITNTGSSWVAGAPFNLVVDITPPAAPQNLAATGSNGQVSLTWNANSELDLAGYNVYRSTTRPVSTTTPLNGSLLTSPIYTDAGVTNGTTYYYAVTAVDTSNNTSTLSNEASATPLTGSSALQFDGTNDHVTFGAAPSLGSATFTLETWFKRTGAGAGTNTGSGGIASAVPLLTKGRAEAEGSTVDMNYFLGIDSSTGKLVADFEDMATGANHPVSGSTVIGSNSWHHAAATYDGSTWKLYLDGNLEATLAVGQTPRSDSIQHASLATAMNSTGVPAGFFQGVLDEARVWNYARTQAEIQSTLHAEVPSAPGLIGRWGLNEGAGTTANDSSGSGINGTLINGPTWVAGTTFNAAPAVNAGPDQTVVMPGGVNLQGTATDDGFPNATLTIVWSKVSGPGTATFSDPSSANTSAQFSVAGTYVLRLSAADGESTSSDDVTVAASLGGNTAINLGGTNAYVTFGDPAKLDLAQFTIETWFMRTGAGIPNTTGINGIASFLPLVTHGSPQAEGSNVDANWMLGINDASDVIAADFEDMASGANHPISGTTLIADNVWHHAAATYDGSTWRLYLDGNLEATLAVNAAPRSDTIQRAALGTMIESDGTTTHGRFQGTLDEARVWNRALSQAEIQANMPLELTSGTGLMARWGLNEGAGTVANDSVSSPANGSLSGSDYTWVTGAPFAVNLAPNNPVLNAPADHATGISTAPTLSVNVSDPENDALTVEFYGRQTAGVSSQPFTVVAIPDTQYYTSSLNGGTPAMFNLQTQWIVSNLATRNIVFVTQLGDITEHGDQYVSEWENANTAMSIIENPATTGLADGIPYGIAPGNHDMTPIGNPTGTTLYNQYFGVARFQGRGYYGGHYGTDNDNHYELFTINGMDFIVFHLEYDPSANASVLTWLDNTLQTYSSRHAIISSHYIISGGSNASFGTQGLAIYNTVKDNNNVFLMLSGHVPSPAEGQRVDIYNGHTIYTLMSDYQGRANGGSAWMRVMEFQPANNQIQVKTYSPWLNQWETDADSQFTVPFNMSQSFQLLGSVNVASGETASLTWNGLTSNTEYEWYAIAQDASHETSSATFSFTTGTTNSAPVAYDQPVAMDEDTTKLITLTASDSDNDPLTYSVIAGPAHGSLSGTAPTLTYTPEANYNGVDSFTFKANDGKADSNTASVSITVNPVNDIPVAVDDAYSTNEDLALTVAAPGLLANDTDVDVNPLTAIKINDPEHGSLNLNADGSFTYTPAANYSGSDSFTYKASDGLLDSSLVSVSITVNPVNNAPVCAATSITTNEDALGTVSPSCSDVDNAMLSYAIAAQPSNGTAVVEAGLLKYTPSVNFNGSDSFTYTANDGEFTSAPAVVSVTVNPVNDPPVANNQTVETNEDTPLAVTLSGSDIEGSPLTYTVIASPAQGTLSGSAPNLIYTPNTNFDGSDSFTFKVNDGTLDSAAATVQITVHAINDLPVANNEAFTTEQDSPLSIAAPGVLANDKDVDGDSLSASVVTDPLHGSLTLSADGSFTYSPASGYTGADGFTYAASDGQGGMANGEVAITVSPVNYPPVADNQDKITDEDVAGGITLTATDADNNILTYAVTSNPAHGTLSGTAPNLTYTPAANYSGPDTFSFKANDGQADSNIAVVSLTVNPVNDPPVVVSQSVSTSEDTSLNVTLSGSDVDGDSLTYQIVTSPAHGSLSGTAPNLIYTPALNYSGSDSFTFKASDGSSDSNTATISITVTPVNDSPVASNQSVTTTEDSSLAITLAASDVDNNSLTYITTNPSHGTLSGTAPNLTYTPVLNFNGLDSFTFKASDGAAESNVATINITVTPVNDAPLAVNDSATTVQETAVTISVLANDSDVDGDTLTVIAVTTPSHGSASINGNSTVTYTPTTSWVGPDSFTYTISDGNGGTASATVNMNVTQNDLIFKDGFNTCSGSAWLSVNLPALSFPISGKTGCGMQVNITSNSPAYVRDDTANLETRYRARFYFNPNGIVMAKNDAHAIFGAYTAQGANTLVVELRKNGSSFQVRTGLLLDTRNRWSYSGWSALPSGWSSIEVDWRAATAAGANNGGLNLWINGTQVANLTGIDNDLQKVDWVALGAVNGIDSGTRSTYYFDEFESRRSNYIGP